MSKVISLKPAGRSSTRRSASEWKALVEGYQRSGESRRSFCARHGVAENTLSWWQWRLRRGKAAMRRKPASTAPLFVEVPTDPVIAATANAVTAWDVELDLGGGMMLRLRRAPC